MKLVRNMDILNKQMFQCYVPSVVCFSFFRQWLLIGQVNNIVIELWLFTCTVAGSPSGQKRGDAMFHVECGNGYLYPPIVL